MIDLHLQRRRFLQLGSLGLAGATLPHVLAAEAEPQQLGRAKSCILFYMCGGASQLDMFDMKPPASAEIRGPFRPIASSVPGVPVCEHLPRIAQQLHHFVQIRSLTHQETIHPQAVYQMLTGFLQTSSLPQRGSERVDMPHLGSAFAQADSLRAALPKHIRLPEDTRIGGGGALTSLRGQDAGILRPEFAPFPIEITPEGVLTKPDIGRLAEISRHRLADRMGLLARLNAKQQLPLDPAAAVRLDSFHQQAFDILSAPSVQQAFDIEREAVAIHERYGRHRQGQSLLLARRLVEAGARFVTVYWGPDEQDWADGKPLRIAGNPWDTHRNHFPLLSESLLPRLDQALAALVADLHERGLLQDTLIIWMGDFGRTPRISRPWASRDHWPGAFTALLAGAGVKGGAIYGRTDQLAAEVTDSPVSPADLTATIFAALGIDPRSTIPAANGLLHRLSSGQPVRGLFA